MENLNVAMLNKEFNFLKKMQRKRGFWHFNKAMLEHLKSCKPSTFIAAA